jgi:hypothetical protein
VRFVHSKLPLNAALRRQHSRFQASLQLRSPVLSGYSPDEQFVVVQLREAEIYLVDKRVKNFKRFGLRVSQLGRGLYIREDPEIVSTKITSSRVGVASHCGLVPIQSEPGPARGDHALNRQQPFGQNGACNVQIFEPGSRRRDGHHMRARLDKSMV